MLSVDRTVKIANLQSTVEVWVKGIVGDSTDINADDNMVRIQEKFRIERYLMASDRIKRGRVYLHSLSRVEEERDRDIICSRNGRESR